MNEIINKVHHADCLEFMRGMPDKCVDLVLTDPPYGVKFAKWDNGLADMGWLVEARRIAVVVIVISGTSHLFMYPPPIWTACWARPGSIQRAAGRGFSHWEPILIYGSNPLLVDFRIFPAKTNAPSVDHPCPKPIAVMEWLAREGCCPSGIILDPFCGSGTTLVAAKMLGRRYIGIDIEERYVKIAEERLRNTTPPLPFVADKQEQGSLGI